MKLINKYSDTKQPGAFLSKSGFLKNNPDFKEEIKSLDALEAVTLHKPLRKKFVRNKFFSPDIDVIWQADLVDLKNIRTTNSYYNYILTCIDIFSKFSWAIPIKKKTAMDTRDAFEIILKSGRKPKKIQVDEGNEFKGICKKYLSENGVELYFINSKIKAGVVERFNRTLKEKMFRMFTFNKNKRYIKHLDDLLESYNNSYHRSIKMKPTQVNSKNTAQVFKNLYGYYKETGPTESIKFTFKIGDYVRISKEKNIFEKGYTVNWSEEIFLIDELLPRIPPVYKIISINGEKLTGIFYKEELQKVPFNQFPYDVFEVLDEKETTVQIKQINSQDVEPIWVDKTSFLE